MFSLQKRVELASVFYGQSFTTGDEEIIYLHSDYTLREKANTEVFRMNLNSGVRTQVTVFTAGLETAGNFTKSPDSEFLVFVGDGDLYSLNLQHGRDNAVVPLSSWLCAGTSAHEL